MLYKYTTKIHMNSCCYYWSQTEMPWIVILGQVTHHAVFWRSFKIAEVKKTNYQTSFQTTSCQLSRYLCFTLRSDLKLAQAWRSDVSAKDHLLSYTSKWDQNFALLRQRKSHQPCYFRCLCKSFWKETLCFSSHVLLWGGRVEWVQHWLCQLLRVPKTVLSCDPLIKE